METFRCFFVYALNPFNFFPITTPHETVTVAISKARCHLLQQLPVSGGLGGRGAEAARSARLARTALGVRQTGQSYSREQNHREQNQSGKGGGRADRHCRPPRGHVPPVGGCSGFTRSWENAVSSTDAYRKLTSTPRAVASRGPQERGGCRPLPQRSQPTTGNTCVLEVGCAAAVG